MMHWPDNPDTDFPDARDHAFVILEAADGDTRLAQESVMALASSGQLSVGYAQRLLWLLMSHGEC
jgi:hypothetical protein